MESTDVSIVQEIARLATSASDVQDVEIALDIEQLRSGKLQFLMAPPGVTPLDITKNLIAALPNPLRRRGTVTLTTLSSFADFVRRMYQPQTVLFADAKKSTITAIFDYHDPINNPDALHVGDPPVAPTMASIPEPQWGQYRAVYAFPLARQWTAWMELHKKPLTQSVLASHIEENILDVRDPAGMTDGPMKDLVQQLGMRLGTQTELLRVARDMALNVSEEVRQAVNTTTGEIIVGYSQAHNPTDGKGGEIKVPTAFLICIPVFLGGDQYQQLTRLRYVQKEGKVTWSYDIYALDRVLEDAFTNACDAMALKTGAPLFYGEPPNGAAGSNA